MRMHACLVAHAGLQAGQVQAHARQQQRLQLKGGLHHRFTSSGAAWRRRQLVQPQVVQVVLRANWFHEPAGRQEG